jgi:hypothetical protein
MQRVLESLSLVLVLGFAASALWPADACLGQVRINEILADPASDWDGDGISDFKDDEWVEIVNVGASAVAIDDLRLSDASNALHYGFSGTLAPGAQRLVVGSESVAWESAEGVSTVGLSLNNSGDTVRLWQLSGTDTLLVDEYTYASHESVDDRSTARVPDGNGTWTLFDALNPYSGEQPPLGTGCPPTPGEPNACPVSVEPRTWARVKSLFTRDPAQTQP